MTARVETEIPTGVFTCIGNVLGVDVFEFTGPATACPLGGSPVAVRATDGTESATPPRSVPSALADVLADQDHRLELLGELLELLTPPPPSQWSSLFAGFLRRKRVDHVHELDADDLAELIRQSYVVHAARGQR